MAARHKLQNERNSRKEAASCNGSNTSYEDIPEMESRPNVLSSTNRHSVMHALQNLQEKIHRLELDRSNAAGDMECLASETAQFRRMLSLPDAEEEEVKEQDKSNTRTQPLGVKQTVNCFGFCPQMSPATEVVNSNHVTSNRRLPRSTGHPDVVQPSIDFHNCDNETREEAQAASDCSYNAEDEKFATHAPFLHGVNHGASGASECLKPAGDSSKLSSQMPQSVAIALTSAETRCSILEQQLSYMRTLLESAERDRNEAQRRCRHRGVEFQTWQRDVEVQLGRLEADLKTERDRNRVLCEKAVLCTEKNVQDLPEAVEHKEQLQTPPPTWKPVPASRSRAVVSPSVSRRSSRSGAIPFVAGKATTPSHNVGVSLQAVMQMTNRKSARRRQHADQVDRQLGQDVRVVLEELIAEYEALCSVHGRCVRQLAAATTSRAKSDLQHQLTDLVNRMDVKGQQVGRLRAYLASIEANAVSQTSSEEAESERRARSIRFLNKARQLQNLGVHSADLDWH